MGWGEHTNTPSERIELRGGACLRSAAHRAAERRPPVQELHTLLARRKPMFPVDESGVEDVRAPTR
jgi:hypothetical protein